VRHPRLMRASVLAFALTLAIVPAVSATPPGSGYRDIQSFANASFAQQLDDCTQARLTVLFTGGDNLQSPIGSGKPGSWGDAGVSLAIWDTCADPETQIAFYSGVAYHPDEVDGFTSALVTGTETDLWADDGSSVHVTIDIYWVGTGSPVVTTDQHDGYQRVTRTAPAEIVDQGENPTAVVVGEPWPVAFSAADQAGAEIGWAAEIDTMAPPPCAPRPDGMTSWWTGDGVTTDGVGGYDATRMGDARFGPAMVRAGFALNGRGAYLAVSDAPALDVAAGDFTISAWVRFASTDGEQVIAERWLQGDESNSSLGWTLTKLENNAILLAVSGPDNLAGNVPEWGVQTDEGLVEPGPWYLVTARRAGLELALFVNGVQVAGAELPSAFGWDLSSPLPLVFGQRADERGFFLNGTLDEIQLFVGTAVSDGDIWNAYAAGASGTCRSS
jgi:hypothetical protein